MISNENKKTTENVRIYYVIRIHKPASRQINCHLTNQRKDTKNK